MKYVTRAAFVSDDEGEVCSTANEVIVEDEEPTDTGLLDHMGNKIYRVTDRAPLGFRLR